MADEPATHDAPLDALRRALRDRYRIVREIGVGGMARVFLAEDVRHKRDVAIKVLRAPAGEEGRRTRFAREIETVARLSHPNILPLLDSGSAGDTFYFVMPYVPGSSLRNVLDREGPLELDRAITHGIEICDGLSHAHARGTVHRDIKPENILVWEQRVQIADFGIALALDTPAAARLTSTGKAIGTPLYVSPEQAAGSRDVDQRTDVYGVGLVLREMAMGHPHSGGLDLPRDRRLRRLERIIRKATARTPDARFASVDELGAALRAVRDSAHPGAALKKWSIALSSGAAAIATGILLTYGSCGPSAGPDTTIVLPFENRTGRAGLDDLGIMASHWLTEGLQSAGLGQVVPSSAAVDLFERVTADGSAGTVAEEMAALTGARYVVEGAYYLQRDTLRFRAEVTDSRDRTLVASLPDVVATVDAPLEGVEALRGRLTGWMAARTDEQLRAHVETARATPTLAAYSAWAEGLTRYSGGDNRGAAEAFTTAFEMDPTFATPLLYAAISRINLGEYAVADSLLGVVDRSRGSLGAYDAAWLDYAIGLAQGRNEEALSAIRVAAAMAPGTKAVYNHAAQAFQTGYVEEALEELTSLRPDRGAMVGFLPYRDLLTSAYHVAGRHADELRTAEVGYSADRLITHVAVVRASAAARDLERLEATLATARRLPQDPISWTLGDLLVEAAEELQAHGAGDLAERYYRQADSWYRENESAPRHLRNVILAAYRLGELDSLSEILDDAVARRADPTLVRGYRGLLAARVGDDVTADSVADVLLLGESAYDRGRAHLLAARIAAVQGRDADAASALGTAFARGLSFGLWAHRESDFFDSDEPSLRALLSPRR